MKDEIHTFWPKGNDAYVLSGRGQFCLVSLRMMDITYLYCKALNGPLMGRFLKVRLEEKDTTVNIGLGKSKVCYRDHPQMKSSRGKVEGLHKIGIWGGFQGLTG